MTVTPDLPGVLEALRAVSSEVAEALYVARPDAARTFLFVSGGIQPMLGWTPEEWLALPDPFWSALHPDDVERVRSEIDRWDRQQPLQLRYRFIARDGRHVSCRETLAAVTQGPKGPQQQGILSDVTELEVLQVTLGAVVGAVDPKTALAPFCDAIAALLGLEWTGFVDTDAGDGLLCRYGPLARRESLVRFRTRALGGLGGRARTSGRVECTTAAPEETFPREVRALAGDLPFAFAANVPDLEGMRGRGLLLGAGRRTRELDVREKRIVDAVARQAALALHRADLVARLERIGSERQRLAESVVLAHEDERRRIASELHDGAGQTLMASVIQIDLASASVPEGPAKKALQRAREQVETTLEELRGLAHALRPAALDKLGLAEALHEMGRALAGGGLQLEVDVPATAGKLEPDLTTAIFRIAQAALTNVARHAKARRATLRLEMDEAQGTVTLEVADDGRGFGQAPLVEGIGLVAMRERAHAVGGDLAVSSQPGGGTRVRAVMPLSRHG